MKNILTLASKELYSYFRSPMAYIVLVLTTIVFNVMFFMIIDQAREASLRDMFKLMEFMFVFIIPILTMRTLAEERRSGTIEFLLTCPIKSRDIVLGKYLGSVAFFLILMGLTSIYYFIIEYYAQPDRLPILIGYLGIILEGALFLAIGLLTSSATKNQIVAAISSYAILFMLYFSISFIKYTTGNLYQVIQYLSVWSHAENLFAGLLTVSDLVYYLSGIAFCLYLTYRNIEKRA